jgi:arabinan endo-1,5-alpha-L-arabinosidase
MKSGGGTIVYGSQGNVYGPGGQGVLKDYNGRDVLYFHYGKSSYLSYPESLLTSSVPTQVSYRDEDKLLGWLYIDYEDGWPKLVY